MAESFVNSLTRAAGIMTSYANCTVGAISTSITVSSNTGIAVSDLVDNQNFLAGTKVHQIAGTTIYTDLTSTNTSSSTTQTVKFLGMTTAYTAADKSILIGGTFANNTENSVNLTVEVFDQSVGVTTTGGSVALASKIPVPNGSSFVISDAGKTVLETSDELRVYCDANDALDVTLGILKGVS